MSFAKRAPLPEDRRLREDCRVPHDFPVWGSIRDVWFVEACEPSAPGCWSTELADRVVDAWQQVGIEFNGKKNINAQVDQEVQGLMIPRSQHFCMAVVKRILLFKSMLHLLMQPKPFVGALVRAIWQWRFAACARPCMRSVLGGSAIRTEVLWAALLPPFAQSWLGAELCPGICASDASLGGHGLARTTTPTDFARDMGVPCVHRGTYTQLNLSHELAMNEDAACPLQRINFDPSKFFWHDAGRARNHSHILLEESDSYLSALSTRLLRPHDYNTPVIHPLDGASTARAMIKGRSASCRFNGKCRHQTSIEIACNVFFFIPWITSAATLADRPRSAFVIRS